MHIALVTTGGNRAFAGGVPAVTIQRARYLTETGHSVSIVCHSHGDWWGYEERDGIHIHAVKPWKGRIEATILDLFATWSPFYLRSLRRTLNRIHLRQKVDLVDLQDAAAILGVGPFCKQHNVPMTFTIHGSAILNPAPRPWIGRKLHIWYESLAWKQARLVLPVSHFIATAGESLGDYSQKTHVVPNTIKREWLERGRRRVANADSAKPLSLLFLARIAPEKRLDTLLLAMKSISAEVATLAIYGGGPLEEEMKQMANDLALEDRVTFHGFVSNREAIEKALIEADVFVFPTQFEAMSIALLEAMAFGLTPVASDIAPNVELLPPQYMFPYGDSNALARSILDLHENRRRLAVAQREMVEIASRFERETVYRDLVRHYVDAARLG